MKIQSAIDLQPNVKQAREAEDSKFRQASKLYEQQFIREMVKAMRSTVKPSGLIKQNFAEKLFREQLDEEYVQGWSNRGGVGLSDMIYSQLKERFSAFSQGPVAPPEGPLPLNRPENTQGTEPKKGIILLDTPQSPESSQFLFQGGEDKTPVSSPWPGKVSQKFEIEDQRQVLEIQHENGLKSKLVFQGQMNTIAPGDFLQAGQQIGTTQGDSATVSWKVFKST